MPRTAKPGPGRRRSRRRRGWWIGPSALVVLLLAWIAGGVWILGFPPEDDPARSDVVVVLGPATPDRYEKGVELVEAGYSNTLVISVGQQERETLGFLCDGENNYEVICFSPAPSSTRGEAQAVGALVEEHGWESMMIVTMRPHMARALLYFQRCFDGEILMVDDGIARPEDNVIDLFLYESGAFVKFFTAWEC